MFKRLMLLLLPLVMSITGMAQAAGDETLWFAYLFDHATQTLVRVNADGSQQTYSLGLPENVSMGASTLAFTPDGSKVAFCTADYNMQAASQVPLRFYVRDLTSQTNIVDREIGTGMSCTVSRASFNTDGTRVAVNIMNYYPGAPDVDTAEPAWQLMVFDAATGELVNELNAHTPGVPALEMLGGAATTDVKAFYGNELIFGVYPSGIGGSFDTEAQRWQLDTGSLTPAAHWGQTGVEQVGDELIWPVYADTLPAGMVAGPMPTYNLLMYAQGESAAQTLYHSPDWIIADVVLINHGQQIAMLLYESYDPNTPEQMPGSKWVALDRAGTITELTPGRDFDYSSMVAAPGGYALLTMQVDQNGQYPAYTLELVVKGQPTTLWTAQSPDLGASWELAWASPLTPSDGLTPFPAVGG